VTCLLDTDPISCLQRRSGPEYAALAVFDDLQAQRVRVATMDLRIAAIALSRGLVLLTRNSRDFARVPALVTEDWTA
jgi:tRNA(fMet)-specific endonuclease VapC